MKLAAVAVLLCTMAMAQSSNSTETPKADVIFRNANIYTGLKDRSTFGETQRRAEALAIRGDRVVAIGGNSEIIKLSAGKMLARYSTELNQITREPPPVNCEIEIKRCVGARLAGKERKHL